MDLLNQSFDWVSRGDALFPNYLDNRNIVGRPILTGHDDPQLPNVLELGVETPLRKELDQFLAGALRSHQSDWPVHWIENAVEKAVIKRILFHGIAAIIVDDVDSRQWPEPVLSAVSHQAQAQAMWEMEHIRLLNEILSAMMKRDLKSCFMKGTASAYEYYAKPHHRTRGDTDLLINKVDVKQVRSILAEVGFSPDGSIVEDVEIAYQESWLFPSKHGYIHLIDVHWRVLNSSYLSTLFPSSECIEHRVALRRAPNGAYFMGSVHHLLHTCLHRSMHRTAPYFVDGERHSDIDRLIWANDISLVAARLSAADWSVLTQLAVDLGVAEACAESLKFAQSTLFALIPDEAMRILSDVSGEANSNFLLREGRATRAWRNLASVPWSKKVAYLSQRTFPPASLIRAKYPQYVNTPLIFLYFRRALELAIHGRSPK